MADPATWTAVASVVATGATLHAANTAGDVGGVTQQVQKSSVISNNKPATVIEEEDVDVGSSRSDARKGRDTSRSSLMANQNRQPVAKTTGLKI